MCIRDRGFAKPCLIKSDASCVTSTSDGESERGEREKKKEKEKKKEVGQHLRAFLDSALQLHLQVTHLIAVERPLRAPDSLAPPRAHIHHALPVF